MPDEGVQARPTPAQRRWLQSGLSQAGGKLPLFDEEGQRIASRTIKSCVRHGWAEPWLWRKKISGKSTSPDAISRMAYGQNGAASSKIDDETGTA